MEKDRCDFLDLLEEAALGHRRLEIHLRGGQTVAKEVVDVVTESGEDYAVLEGGDRIAVSHIIDCRRMARPSSSYDAKL